jgi:D-alanine transaminase
MAWVAGRLVPFEQASVPVEDRGLQFGESLYEVVAVTAGAPRLLPEHAERMRAGARVIGLEAGAPSLDEWVSISRALLDADRFSEGVLYAQLTGGTAPRAHLVDPPPRPTFFAYLAPFRFPRATDVARGIRAVTLPDVRWMRRDLKTTMLLPAVLAKKEARVRGADEALFVGEGGLVHEGASSTVFALEGRRLATPEPSEDLLPGTIGPLVAELARKAGLEIAREPVSIERLMAAQEVFVTSTMYWVMPVVAVDGRKVGGGQGGPVASDLAERLRRRLQVQ